MQYTIVFINTETEALEKGDVANDDPETDRQKEQRLILLGNGEIAKKAADKNHDDISVVEHVPTGVLQKTGEQFHNQFTLFIKRCVQILLHEKEPSRREQDTLRLLVREQ